MGVAPTATTTAYDYHPAVVVIKVSEYNVPTGLVTIQNNSTNRYCKYDVSSASAMLLTTRTATTVVC